MAHDHSPGEHHDHRGHGHHHGHGHDHGPPPGGYGRRFAAGIALNLAFVLIETAYGFMAGSLALLADAGHNLSDVLSLGLAWGAAALAGRAASARRTYGFRRATILAAVISALLLLVAMGGIAWEAVGRFRIDAPVNGFTMMVVAGIGVVINTLTALLFARGREGDLNIRAAYLHMAADAALSLGVVVGGAGVLFLGWQWLDPVISLVIVAAIVWSTWDLLRESVDLAVDAVPRQIDPVAVAGYLQSLPGVARVHDLHIWGMSTTDTAMTAHLVMPAGGSDRFLVALAADLKTRFAIAHTTVQVETGDDACEQACQPGAA
jgi:cobalt-zinc-cadmium efflux system protein